MQKLKEFSIVMGTTDELPGTPRNGAGRGGCGCIKGRGERSPPQRVVRKGSLEKIIIELSFSGCCLLKGKNIPGSGTRLCQGTEAF